MKRPLIFAQDPNALKNWLTACGPNSKVLFDVRNLTDKYSPKEHLLLIQISETSTIDDITELAKAFDVIVFANQTSDLQGLQLFKQGIKGYLNTYATVERIKQAVATISAGSIWLGQNVMQAMIKSLIDENLPSEDWKELLTDREQETTGLVLQSKTNKEIAEELNITERTVKAHLHNVFEKLEVSDRLALVLKIKNWQ
jgi:DNA-binding NarL/FixJ family response regulator